MIFLLFSSDFSPRKESTRRSSILSFKNSPSHHHRHNSVFPLSVSSSSASLFSPPLPFSPLPPFPDHPKPHLHFLHRHCSSILEHRCQALLAKINYSIKNSDGRIVQPWFPSPRTHHLPSSFCLELTDRLAAALDSAAFCSRSAKECFGKYSCRHFSNLIKILPVNNPNIVTQSGKYLLKSLEILVHHIWTEPSD